MDNFVNVKDHLEELNLLNHKTFSDNLSKKESIITSKDEDFLDKRTKYNINETPSKRTKNNKSRQFNYLSNILNDCFPKKPGTVSNKGICENDIFYSNLEYDLIYDKFEKFQKLENNSQFKENLENKEKQTRLSDDKNQAFCSKIPLHYDQLYRKKSDKIVKLVKKFSQSLVQDKTKSQLPKVFNLNPRLTPRESQSQINYNSSNNYALIDRRFAQISSEISSFTPNYSPAHNKRVIHPIYTGTKDNTNYSKKLKFLYSTPKKSPPINIFAGSTSIEKIIDLIDQEKKDLRILKRTLEKGAERINQDC